MTTAFFRLPLTLCSPFPLESSLRGDSDPAFPPAASRQSRGRHSAYPFIRIRCGSTPASPSACSPRSSLRRVSVHAAKQSTPFPSASHCWPRRPGLPQLLFSLAIIMVLRATRTAASRRCSRANWKPPRSPAVILPNKSSPFRFTSNPSISPLRKSEATSSRSFPTRWTQPAHRRR